MKITRERFVKLLESNGGVWVIGNRALSLADAFKELVPEPPPGVLSAHDALAPFAELAALKVLKVAGRRYTDDAAVFLPRGSYPQTIVPNISEPMPNERPDLTVGHFRDALAAWTAGGGK